MSDHNCCYTSSNLEPTPENKKIYQAILAKIKLYQPKSVLEIGAGTGTLGNEISQLGIRYTGLEPDADSLNFCKNRFPHLSVLEGSCYDAPEKLALGEFDFVFSTDVIEHLFSPRKLLNFKFNHVKSGGHVLTCTPDFGNYWKNILYAITHKWDTVHSPTWDGGHIKFFSRKWLRILLEEQGFEAFEWATITNVNIPILPMSILSVCKRP